MTRTIYLICPVRCVSAADAAAIAEYVARLEADGHRVHFPPRDVDQSDPTGTAICTAHRAAMRLADEVHVWWDYRSEGSRFDLGMAYAFEKPLVLARAIAPQQSKGFAAVLLALAVERAA